MSSELIERQRGPMKPQQAWALTNFGRLVRTAYRRRDIIAYAEEHCGAPWNECKRYMEVRKVVISELEQ